MEISYEDIIVQFWPYVFLILAIILIIKSRQNRNLSYIFCLTVFSLYLIFVIDKTLFPIHIPSPFGESWKIHLGPFSKINLIPFNLGTSNLRNSYQLRFFLYEIFANILLTIPFGFGVSFVAHVKQRNFYWIPLAVGLGIEMTQLLISFIIRFLYRAIDINDVILNAFGVLIGYGIFRVFAWIYLSLTKRFNIKHRGFSAYIYEVIIRGKAE
jgi:glycopeptide antibiotics resistance protein